MRPVYVVAVGMIPFGKYAENGGGFIGTGEAAIAIHILEAASP